MREAQYFNTNCKPPFKLNGEKLYSYLCKVWNGAEWAYFTFVYAKNREDAIARLDVEYQQYYENREVI